MNAADWDGCTDSQTMLDFLWSTRGLTARKLRLFFCACARRLWDPLAGPEYIAAVEVAERFADSRADEEPTSETVRHSGQNTPQSKDGGGCSIYSQCSAFSSSLRPSRRTPAWVR